MGINLSTANGNKTRHTWTNDEFLTVDTGSNRVAAMASHSYTYDGRGNRATQTYGSSTATYSYDGFNRTTGISRNAATSYAEPNYATVSLPAGANAYGYNAFNERVWKQTGAGVKTRFVYGPGSALLGERRESDGQWTNYLWFGDLKGTGEINGKFPTRIAGIAFFRVIWIRSTLDASLSALACHAPSRPTDCTS